MIKQIFGVAMIIDIESDEIVVSRIAYSEDDAVEACVDLVHMVRETNIREDKYVWRFCYCFGDGLWTVDKLGLNFKEGSEDEQYK